MTYRCEAGCEATFEHPGPEDDCETIGGHCAHLVCAGWVPCSVRVEVAPRRLLFVRGGWLCPACVVRYGECPTHGRFAFVERSIEEINAGVKPRAVYQADEP